MSFQDGYIKWLRTHIGHQLIYLVYTTTFVFNEDHHLLVQERYDFDWLSVPGGALELGESLSACALRETYEETGVQASLEGLIGVFSHPAYELLYPNGDRVQPWMATFVARTTEKNTNIQIDGKETLKASFRPVDEVRYRLPQHYQDALAAYEKNGTKGTIESVHAEPELKAYYPILREKLGHARIILPGGSAVIYNDAGQVLAVHEVATGKWDLPSGFADIGESSSATVVREVKEETGLDVEPVGLIGLYSEPPYSYVEIPSNGDQIQLVDLFLECRIVDGTFTPQDGEVDGMQFMDIEALIAQPSTHPHRRRMLEDLLQTQNNRPFIR